ncbi:MAG TPA: RluA family pseudouridine synthase [Acidobacteriaceae bacterium]|nr:RluA family pseudouridine synthase [Acidobacteriaceae bacterium]
MSSKSSKVSHAVNGKIADKIPEEIEMEIDDDVLDEIAVEIAGDAPREFTVDATTAGQRLDQFLVHSLPDVSRSRVQQWIERGQVLVNGASLKASWKVRAGEQIRVVGDLSPEPLRAVAENIPLDVVFEDEHLAVIHKPAGMMVHAGSGATEDARSRGTLVNALLHYFGTLDALSSISGPIRPGIVHRLDKQTSGLILVAKHDNAHRHLAAMFADRHIEKTYIALVHGHVEREKGTIDASISRDRVHRTRMTTRRTIGRTAISHYVVQERITGAFGKFSLLEVRIETGRTHQIRVHLSSIGHPVVGDTLYGAPKDVLPVVTNAPKSGKAATPRARRTPVVPTESFTLERNFLHAAKLKLKHPETGEPLQFAAPLPEELTAVLQRLRGAVPDIKAAASKAAGSKKSGSAGTI